MNRRRQGALAVFQPGPDLLYSLDAAAHFAGISRRALLRYCRAGVVQPVWRPPYGMMAFTEADIHTIRRIEYARVAHGIDVAWIKTVLDLRAEVDRLRAELRFWRGH